MLATYSRSPIAGLGAVGSGDATLARAIREGGGRRGHGVLTAIREWALVACTARSSPRSAHRLLGELALAQDRGEAGSESAVAHFETSISTLREIGAENELARAYAGYGRLQARLGRPAAARDYLTQALDIFERLRTLGEPDKVRAELAEWPAR